MRATAAVSPGENYPNLDFLRSSAVLFVCVCHLLAFRGIASVQHFDMQRLGTWGVVIFFVHTCLVLMLSLERHGSNFGKLFFSFMIRRCFRIYPLSILVVTTVIAFRLPMAGITHEHFVSVSSPNAWTVFCNLALTQNLAHQHSVLLPLWSLPYEIQMYLFLPALFLITMPPRSVVRSVLLWIGALGLAIMASSHPSIPDFVGYTPLFMSGVVAYRLQQRKLVRLPAFLWPLLLGLLTLFVISGGHWARYWGASLILGFAIPIFSQLRAKWMVVPSHLMARYSYGVYLTHFFCIWLAFERLSNLPKIARLFVFVILFIGLPVLLYHLVEEPMIRMGKKLAKGGAKTNQERRSLSTEPAPTQDIA